MNSVVSVETELAETTEYMRFEILKSQSWILLLHPEKQLAMSKNVIHNFNLSIKNSTDIKSSEDLTKAIIKELAKVSKEMNQQKDIVQQWQEQKNQNATAILKNSSASTEGGANDSSAETIKKTAMSISNTPLVSEETTSTSSALTGGGVVDTGDRTIMSRVLSDNTTSLTAGAESNTLNFSSGITTQTYASVAAQQILTVPQTLQTNNNEPKTEVVRAEIKKRLEAVTATNNTVETTYWRDISKAFDEGATAKDFVGKKEEGHFKQMYSELDKIHEITVNNVNWKEVSGLMILKLSEVSKERKDVYLKRYYEKLIKEIKNPEINIQQLFLEHDELFLLLKSIFPNLPDKIIINTQNKVYPDLSPQRMYPGIGVEKMYFIWSGTLLSDYKFNGKELQDELGLNVYDMDARQYDPAIGRWMVHDPIVHHSQSPYSDF